MWFQDTEAHYSVFTAAQNTELAALRHPGPAAFCLLGLHNGGDDVIQEVWEAALQLVTLTDKTTLTLLQVNNMLIILGFPYFN